MDTYLFKVKWYSEPRDKEVVSYGAIGASSYSDAVKKIEIRFSYIDDICIRELNGYDGFYFLNEEEYNKTIKENEKYV